MHIEFTKHARDRMEKRNISEDGAINTIKFPEKTEKVGNAYYVKKDINRLVLKVVYIRENI